MRPTDLTGWLQDASEATEKLRADICEGVIPDHPDSIDAVADIADLCKFVVDECARYRRDCLESPQQRREDARADSYSKRSNDD